MFVTACGGSKDQPPVMVQPDASDPDAPVVIEPPNVMTVETFDEVPLFIRYRNGNGPWLEPTANGGTYEFKIDESYELVAVCGDDTNGYDVGFEGNTYFESGGQTFLPCFAPFDPGTTHVVSGTMVQPGSVAVSSDAAMSATGNWNFALDTAEGKNDLVAVGNGRILIRRNLDVQAAMTVPTVDVTAGGALISAPYTLVGTQADDTVSTSTMLLTPNGFSTITDDPGSTARLVSAAQLTTNDRQYLRFNAGNGTLSRSAFARYTASLPTTITLLPRIPDVQLSATGATWTSIPDGDIEVYMFSGLSSVHELVTQSFLGPQKSLTIDTNIPGFKPEWKLNAIDYQSFEVSHFESGVSLRTTIEKVAELKARPQFLHRRLKGDIVNVRRQRQP